MPEEVRLDISLLQQFVQDNEYLATDTAGAWNLMGVRAAAAEGKRLVASDSAPDRYNDTLLLWGKSVSEEPVLDIFLGSVDPGRYYTERPLNARGCAHLVNGAYRYKRGIHRQIYPALVQAGPVTIWRDRNQNFVDDDRVIEAGEFGINIHAGGSGELIGPNSAGCQVLFGGRYGEPWKRFMRWIDAGRETVFPYVLIDFAALLAHARAQERDAPLAPDDNALPERNRKALLQALTGLAILYDCQALAGLEDSYHFVRELHALRQTGLLKNLKVELREPIAAGMTVTEARQRMLGGFRLLYGALIPAGLDQSFHERLNRLRRFGPLAQI